MGYDRFGGDFKGKDPLAQQRAMERAGLPATPGGTSPELEQVNKPRYVSAETAKTEYYLWDDKTRARFKNLLTKAGLADGDTSPRQLATLWEGVIADAVTAKKAGVDVSPWDILDTYAKDPAGSGAGGKARSVTSVTIDHPDLTDPDTARAILNRSLHEALGRVARPSEIAAFQRALNAREKGASRKTTTVSSYNAAGEFVGSESTHSGTPGPSADVQDQMALDQAKESDEYGAYQAAGNYMPILFKALQGI